MRNNEELMHAENILKAGNRSDFRWERQKKRWNNIYCKNAAIHWVIRMAKPLPAYVSGVIPIGGRA